MNGSCQGPRNGNRNEWTGHDFLANNVFQTNGSKGNDHKT